MEEMCRLGFHRWDIVRIFAEPYAHNAASRRVLEKAGFHLEGVMAPGSNQKWTAPRLLYVRKAEIRRGGTASAVPLIL